MRGLALILMHGHLISDLRICKSVALRHLTLALTNGRSAVRKAQKECPASISHMKCRPVV